MIKSREEILKNYFYYLYDHFINQNYVLGKKPNLYCNTHYYLINKNASPEEKKGLSLSPLTKDDFYDFNYRKQLTYLENNHDQIEYEWFLNFYKNNPDNRNDILKNLDRRVLPNEYLFKQAISTSDNKEKLFHFLKDLAPTWKEAKYILQNISINYLTINTIKIRELADIVDSYSISTKERNAFLLSFFQKRKTQINERLSRVGFLNELNEFFDYNKEEILPYGKFCIFIKQYFETEINFDFFNNPHQKSTVIKIDLKKTEQQLNIGSWSDMDYLSLFTKISQGYKTHYNLNEIFFQKDDNSTLLIITFIHDNEQFDKNIYEKYTKEYIKYVKQMNQQNVTLKNNLYRILDSEFFTEWFNSYLLKNQIENKLIPKTEKKQSKFKI